MNKSTDSKKTEMIIDCIQHQVIVTLLGTIVANHLTSGEENIEKIVDFFIHKETLKNQDVLEVYYLLRNEEDEEIILLSSLDEYVEENLLLKVATKIADLVFPRTPDNNSTLRNFLSEEKPLNIEKLKELTDQVRSELHVKEIMNHLRNHRSSEG